MGVDTDGTSLPRRSSSRMHLNAVFGFVFGLATVRVAAVQVSVQHTGRTLTLGNVSYFVPPSPVSSLPNAAFLVKPASGDLIPFSVIPTSKTVFDQNALEATIAQWSAKDDVWSEAFLTGTPLVSIAVLFALTLCRKVSTSASTAHAAFRWRRLGAPKRSSESTSCCDLKASLGVSV